MLTRLLALLLAASASFGLSAQSLTPSQLLLGTNAVAADRLVLWQDGGYKQVPPTLVGPASGTTGRAVLAAETAAAIRAILSLVIGTDIQAHSGDLDVIGALPTTAWGRYLLTSNSLPYQPLNGDLTAISSSGTGAAGRYVLGLATTNGILAYLAGQPLNGDLTAISSSGTGAAGRAVLAIATTNGILAYLAGQPLNGDLTAISSSGTGAAGRAVLATATANGILNYIAGQPLDSDLTAIAALATTSVGRSLLAIADAAAGRTILSAQQSNGELTAIAALGTTSFGRSLLTSNSLAYLQPISSELTAISALSGTTFGRSFLTLADAAAGRALISAQQSNGELTAIAALSTTSFGRSLLTSNSLPYQISSAELTAIAALSGTTFGRSFLTLVDAAAGRTLISAQQSSGELSAIAALSGTGIMRRTGSSAWSLGTAVTLAEMASMADGRLLGRSAGSSGVPQEITIGSGLSLAGGTLSASGGGSSSISAVFDGSTTAADYTGINGSLAFTNGGTIIHVVSHGLTSGDVCWFQVNSSGVAQDAVYFATVVDSDNFKISTSNANRLASTFVAATADGTCYARRWSNGSTPRIAPSGAKLSGIDGVARTWSDNGSYAVHFTSAAADTNYQVSGSCQTLTAATPLFFTISAAALTTSSLIVQSSDVSGGLTDSPRVSVTIAP